MKTCTKCQIEKDEATDFSRRSASKDGLQPMCKACESLRNAAYRSGHLADLRVYGKGWRDANKSRTRDNQLRYYYNITSEKFDAMLAAQGGRCKNRGCRTENAGAGRRFHIDHDHRCCPEKGRSCGKCIRGLLCHECNTSLGQLGDGYDNDRIFGLYEYAVEHGPKLIGPGALFDLRPVKQRKAA